MTQPLLPGPSTGADDLHQHDGDHHHKAERDQRSCGPDEKRRVLTEEECLVALSQLPALVALGMLTAAKANTIRATYIAILQHYRQTRTTEDRVGMADDGLVDVLARHPELASLLEPLLSDKQIADILARAKDASRGNA